MVDSGQVHRCDSAQVFDAQRYATHRLVHQDAVNATGT